MMDGIDNKILTELTKLIGNEILPKLDTAYSVAMENNAKVNSLVDREKNTYYPEPVTIEKFERLLNINLRLINIIMDFFDPSVMPEDLQQINSELQELKNGW